MGLPTHRQQHPDRRTSHVLLPIVGFFSQSTQDFVLGTLDNLQEIGWEAEVMDRLVLDVEEKRMLQGLVEQHHTRDKTGHRGDLFKGKGEELIILLHGPPGVGKTLTAEMLAETVQRSLMALSVGDIIQNEYELDKTLKRFFSEATDWDAILLLDEADVVLEARSLEDVRRNGIVSVFLRHLEYFKGVLILTTNRLSTMDVAFQSRIQICVEFKELDKQNRMQIWLKLLELKNSAKTISAEHLREVKRNIKTLAKYNLNGRQIRNVLNVADGYAFNEFREAGKMEYRHIRNAANAAREFQRSMENAKSKTGAEQSVWAPYRGGDDF
ncbi:P-loop containing nucleoside triphosphate hydrolase protein [Podospora australis]|uniref:P-loop containing nucleoside triphosphate hydrolase protein n=1 Tax=Podospora australis TaxID=1536484 RepID=A0AAN6WPV7_9PEZI|nr:P-loop containing nucleoside triphosphate hydrolase protein [Podospora australis]